MTNKMKTATKGLIGVLSAFLLVTALSACGAGKTTLAGEWSDDNVTYTVTADTASDSDMFMIGYDVAEGTTALSISSSLESGVLHVALTEPATVDGSTEQPSEDATPEEVIESADIDLENGDNVFVIDAEGETVTTVDVEPGSYMLVVCGDAASPATGVVTIAPAE
ncbi:MAG: hypothetical protein K5859_02480 [Atopobiaceae bacterium]|nr:hypothetical protein [Atopobiaceae bacterium]